MKKETKTATNAVIDKQGSIPYGKSAPAPTAVPGGVARGMGAAKRGGNYKGSNCKDY
jgi:hypothetical protein